jgi:hypothetical protein
VPKWWRRRPKRRPKSGITKSRSNLSGFQVVHVEAHRCYIHRWSRNVYKKTNEMKAVADIPSYKLLFIECNL